MQNLLNLTLSCSKTVQFTFCSSTASVLESRECFLFEEKVSTTPSDAGLTGYSRSKWVAEAICAAASRMLSGTVNILRIGQLTGDTVNGVWNISEAWPLMLSTVDVLGCLPQLEEPLSWLPLDTAGKAVVEITFQNIDNGRQPYVYHLVNGSSETRWSDLLAWSVETRKESFNIVSPVTWLDKLENHPTKHPAKNLLGVWRKAYGNDIKDATSNTPRQKKIFSIVEARKKSSAMQNVLPVDQALLTKIWSWIEDEIRAAKAQVYVSRNRFGNV